MADMSDEDIIDAGVRFIIGDDLYPPEEDGPLIKNAALCNKCGTVAESTLRYQCVSCACGHVSVDGGHQYAKRYWRGGVQDWTELVIEREVANG